MADFYAIIRCYGTSKRPVWRDFVSPPWTTLEKTNEYFSDIVKDM
jgi:hypothetical protein